MVLILDYHHILWDNWNLQVLVKHEYIILLLVLHRGILKIQKVLLYHMLMIQNHSLLVWKLRCRTSSWILIVLWLHLLYFVLNHFHHQYILQLFLYILLLFLWLFLLQWLLFLLLHFNPIISLIFNSLSCFFRNTHSAISILLLVLFLT